MSRLTELEAQQIELTERLKQSIVSGDYDTMRACQRSQIELSDRLFFAKTEQLKADIAELEESRNLAIELLQDFDVELKQQAQIVIAKRGELMEAEAHYNVIKSRQYALENGEIESRRTAIADAKKRLDAHIKSRLNGSGDTGNRQQVAEAPAQFDILEQNYICD